MMRRSKHGEKTIEIDVMTLASVAIVIVMLALAIFGIVRLTKSFMRVSVIEVRGDSPYEAEEIVNSSGIKMKDKLYEVDAGLVEKNIKAYCPYISKVEISTKFPGKIRINVESLAAAWYVEIFEDFYALDADLRVLEETSDNQKFVAGGIPKLTLPSVRSTVVGSTLLYGANDGEIKYAEEFMNAVKGTTFKSRLTLVDIDEQFDIYIQVDGTINVYMGSIRDADVKLDAVERALEDPKLHGCTGAEIDVSNPQMLSVRPKYD